MIAGVGTEKINWRQAFVEVALIGLGVLIALAVDSWWDDKLERIAEIEYLQSLLSEFESNREDLADRIDNEMQRIEYGKRLHTYIVTGFDEIEMADLNRLIGDFYTLPEWDPITGTYDEMVSSGRLLFLRNEVLRKSLSQYSHQLRAIRAREQFSWSNWLHEQSPFLRRYLNVSDFGWVGDYQPDMLYPPDLDGLRSREFHNLVSSWMVARYDIVISYQDGIEAGDKVLAHISSELGLQ